MPNSNNFFKLLSIFLLGTIIGFSIDKVQLPFPAVSSITDTESVRVMGYQNAPITMTEYSDFQCPLCKQFVDTSFATLKEKYIDTGKVKFVYKQFPLGIHPQANDAALAAECALAQGKFWEMHDALFQNQLLWSGRDNHMDSFKKFAADLKLDTGKFADCLSSRKYDGNVKKDYQEGITRSINGTPTFYLNDQVIVGAQPLQTFTEAIDAKLKSI